MPAEQNNLAPAKPDHRRKRFWWDGVLPEALGLCFVGIILGGFTAGYLIADYAWRRELNTTQQAETQTLAQSWAALLGPLADDDERSGPILSQGLGQLPAIRSLRWTAPDGSTKLEWPPVSAPAPGLPIQQLPPAPLAATAAVRTATGEPAGLLRIERDRPPGTGYRTALLLIWGLAAGATLAGFAAFYQRLRSHLRPVAAIERSLHSYADGLEKEVLTLTLSDSLGSVARGWNQLIEQLAGLQQQMQSGEVGSVGADVLARFENAMFRRIVDRLPFGVLCAGPDQCVTYANAAVGALLRRSTDELVGQTIGTAVDNPAVQQAVVGAQARAGAGLAVDHTTGKDDQEVTLRFRILPASGEPQGSDSLITVEDVSQLREGQRARDNFLYHVTHELRTPLTNIHAYVETLTQPGFEDEQTRKECYNVLTSETRRLSRLVEDILSISQLEVGSARLEVGEVDLARLIRQMVQDNLGGADEKSIDLTLALPPKVPKISGDKQRLSVLLNNLIGNAVKYTPASGKIHVSVEIREQRILIAVRDNGIGIGPEDQAHVFDKFYRAADEAVQTVSGTGLGLALAREVARLHGGDILLESERGKGSTFTIELPFSPSDKAEVSLR